MKKCKFCMEEIDEKATICPHCRKKQKKSSWPVIIVLLLIIGGVGAAISAYQKQAQLEITNAKGNVDAFGNLVWEGDITNNGDYTQENVKIDITCYTEAREVAGKATTSIKYIKSGETLHFTATGLGQYDADIKCEYKIN